MSPGSAAALTGRVRWIGFAALGVCATALAASTGVSGTVTVSPGCPGPRRIDQDCARPLAAVRVQLIDLAGKAVGTTQTSVEGKFEILAPPGRYRLEAGPEGRQLPRCPPTEVTIEAGTTTAVTIVCDSGMR